MPNDDLLEQARQQWPRLRDVDVGFTTSPANPKDPRKLEAWPPGETGAAPHLRPQALDVSKYGVEVIDPKTRSIDVLGDIVSHFMVNTDPTIKNIYERFQKSLTSQQMDRLRSQYRWSRVHEKEGRSFEDWFRMSGLPAYFRGRAFQQWKDVPPNWYTPEQEQMFDQMMKYLGTGNANPISQPAGHSNADRVEGAKPAKRPGLD